MTRDQRAEELLREARRLAIEAELGDPACDCDGEWCTLLRNISATLALLDEPQGDAEFKVGDWVKFGPRINPQAVKYPESALFKPGDEGCVAEILNSGWLRVEMLSGKNLAAPPERFEHVDEPQDEPNSLSAAHCDRCGAPSEISPCGNCIEPQGEPEYVWRPVIRYDGQKPWIGAIGDANQAATDAASMNGPYDFVRVERAQIGPWEPVGPDGEVEG